jgi:hypothetical protein
MYIVGQEETVGESSVSVVAGVRTVTTNMNGRDALPRLSRPFAFLIRSYRNRERERPGLLRITKRGSVADPVATAPGFDVGGPLLPHLVARVFKLH